MRARKAELFCVIFFFRGGVGGVGDSLIANVHCCIAVSYPISDTVPGLFSGQAT